MLDFIKKINEWSHQKAITPKTSMFSKLWIWLVLSLVFIVLIVLFYWYLQNNAKRLAKALHEKDVAEENLHQIGLKAQLAENIKLIQDLEHNYKEAKLKLIEIDHNVEILDKNHQNNLKEIDKLKNWNDINIFLKSK